MGRKAEKEMKVEGVASKQTGTKELTPLVTGADMQKQ